MARRPYRHNILKTLSQDERARISQSQEPTPPRSIDEYVAWAEGTIWGLRDRLARKAPSEEESAQHAMSFTFDHFGTLARHLDTLVPASAGEKKRALILEVATRAIRFFVFSMPARIVTRSKQPIPIELLIESDDLVEEMSKSRRRLNTYDGRKNWLCIRENMSEKIAQNIARYNYTEAELAERILARRHNVSPGTVHKLLAQAGKDMNAILSQPLKMPTKLPQRIAVGRPSSRLRDRLTKTHVLRRIETR